MSSLAGAPNDVTKFAIAPNVSASEATIVPLIFLAVGLTTLAVFVAVGLVRWRKSVVQARRHSAPHVGTDGRVVWIPLLVLAVLDTAFASAKVLYPTSELSFSAKDVLDFIKAAFWPAVVVIAIALFVKPISAFLEKMTSADVDIAGNKVRLEAKVQAVSASLGEAEAKSDTVAQTEPVSPDRIVGLARAAVSSMALAKDASPPRILCVDDVPRNNTELIESFQSVGMSVDTALDTDEALKKLERKTYDLIITDMARPSGKEAGFSLLDALKTIGVTAPCIVYAGYTMSDPQKRAQAISRGAVAATNSPSEVFHVVTSLAPRLALTRGLTPPSG